MTGVTKYVLYFFLSQLSHPVEICEQGPEANECLLGGKQPLMGSGWGQSQHGLLSLIVSQGGNVP